MGEDAYELLERYADLVAPFVGKRVANWADAADISQETLLAASLKLGTWRGENFRAWLFTIARHLIIDYYRSQGRCRFVEVTELAQDGTELALQCAPEAVPVVCDSRDRLRCWVNCLSTNLPLEEQVAVLLADAHGYLDKESAAELGITVACFKLLLHGAREHLRKVGGGTCARVGPAEGTITQAHSVVGQANGHPHPNVSHVQDSNAPPSRSCQVGARGQSCSGDARCAGRSCQRGSQVEPQGGKCPLRTKSCATLGCVSFHCRLGIKCCRHVPKLLALRATLLEPLRFG